MARVARWSGPMPHYAVGHLDRVRGAFAALAGAPNLVLAGAAYRGVGLPDCIAQGRAAAARVGAVLSGVASEPTPPVEPGEPAAVA
jgi:oxygen-dependent protoporphyrinogen oxidase